MPIFHYMASNLQGGMVRGDVLTDDKSALIHLLQEKELFLISFTEEVLTPSDPCPVPDLPMTSESSVPAEPPRQEKGELKVTLKHKVFLTILLVLGVSIGVWRSQSPRTADNTDLLNEKLTQLRQLKDNRRGIVEQIVGPPYSGGNQPNTSRYFVPPTMGIELTYDREGGAGSATNRWSRNLGIQVFKISDDKKRRP